MSGPTGGINPDKVNYFDLHEYIDRIKLESSVLLHADQTGNEFNKYIKMLSSFSDEVILNHLIGSFRNDVMYSNQIEHKFINPKLISEKNVFFDSLVMDNDRIKNLHDFVMHNPNDYDYRKCEAWVGANYDGFEQVIWWGAKPKDIPNFMDAFIKIYQEKGLSQLDCNPFFKSALMSLLFLRIHPFRDGNGRTSRLIYDMKFTEMVNSIYGTNLKISPLHISMSIYVNKYSYNECLDNIYFDLEHDCNHEINKWFDFLLNMIDEQILYMSSERNQASLYKLASYKNFDSHEVDQMRLRKLQ